MAESNRDSTSKGLKRYGPLAAVAIVAMLMVSARRRRGLVAA